MGMLVYSYEWIVQNCVHQLSRQECKVSRFFGAYKARILLRVWGVFSVM